MQTTPDGALNTGRGLTPTRMEAAPMANAILSTPGTDAPTYGEFLARKLVRAAPTGFEVSEAQINPALFPFQRDIVRWALSLGRAAILAECGLGKTPMQLDWAAHVARHTGRPVLILAPLAVSGQTRREGEKFGIPVNVCRAAADVKPGVNITNYELLDRFDPGEFAGVVLDESSILKSYMGATKRALLAAFAATPYRLACTATPAPNDHLELGNHAEFLGVMPSNEMISRWFINDAMQAGNYRLKGHAAADFWRWVGSWAVAIGLPSDLGYPDEGFALPPLILEQHIVDVDLTTGRSDRLFRAADLSATTIQREKRLTLPYRVARVAELVNGSEEPWLVFCELNDEADALRKAIPEAVEVRGSDALETKEERLLGFAAGAFRVLISKPSICGHGLNFQHCARVAFAGLSYSYEQFYQAVRRTWRFGQARPVEVHVVIGETETGVLETIRRKEADHEELKAAMQGALRETRLETADLRRLRESAGDQEMVLPAWLKGSER